MEVAKKLEVRLNNHGFLVRTESEKDYIVTKDLFLHYNAEIERYTMQTTCYASGDSFFLSYPKIIGQTHNHPLIWERGYPELELGAWAYREDLSFEKKYSFTQGVQRLQTLYSLIETALATGEILGNNILYASPQEINRRVNKDKVWKKLGAFCGDAVISPAKMFISPQENI